MQFQTPLRRRQFLLAGAASSLLLATACTRKQPKGTILAKDATLLCLGDSLTFGQGATAGTSYPQKLEELTGHVTQNAGINGDTAQGALQRLPGLLQENTPGLVLVSIGGNDFLRRMPLDRTKAAIKEIVKTAGASAQVVLIAQPFPDAMALAAGSLKDHPIYAELADETGVALFAGGWSKVLSRSDWRSDQIHANTAGYHQFAELLNQWLREMKFVG